MTTKSLPLSATAEEFGPPSYITGDNLLGHSRFHTTAPVTASRHQSVVVSDLSTLPKVNTRPSATVAAVKPTPTLAFQRGFGPSLSHASGAMRSALMPSLCGPRHLGQSAAPARNAVKEASKRNDLMVGGG